MASGLGWLALFTPSQGVGSAGIHSPIEVSVLFSKSEAKYHQYQPSTCCILKSMLGVLVEGLGDGNTGFGQHKQEQRQGYGGTQPGATAESLHIFHVYSDFPSALGS